MWSSEEGFRYKEGCWLGCRWQLTPLTCSITMPHFFIHNSSSWKWRARLVHSGSFFNLLHKNIIQVRRDTSCASWHNAPHQLKDLRILKRAGRKGIRPKQTFENIYQIQKWLTVERAGVAFIFLLGKRLCDGGHIQRLHNVVSVTKVEVGGPSKETHQVPSGDTDFLI